MTFDNLSDPLTFHLCHHKICRYFCLQPNAKFIAIQLATDAFFIIIVPFILLLAC